MSSQNTSQRAFPATELIATMTGSPVVIGSLAECPVIIIFDNLGTVATTISINGISWKTFAAGTALVLDMRANHGLASNFTFDQGMTFTGNGASGDFSISYLYAKTN